MALGEYDEPPQTTGYQITIAFLHGDDQGGFQGQFGPGGGTIPGTDDDMQKIVDALASIPNLGVFNVVKMAATQATFTPSGDN